MKENLERLKQYRGLSVSSYFGLKQPYPILSTRIRLSVSNAFVFGIDLLCQFCFGMEVVGLVT